MNIQDSIEKKHYVATEHDVELLAASHFNSDTLTRRSDGQYLRILVAALKGQFGGATHRGPRRKLTAEDFNAQGAFLAETHTRYYAAVLKGITTPEVADDEALDVDTRRARASIRNARAGFARSAASTVQAFLRAGGDIRVVDVNVVTKTELRNWTRQAVTPDENPRLHAVHVTIKRLTRDMEALAEEDAGAARVAVEEAMQTLQGILDGLDATARPGGLASTVLPPATAAPPTDTQVFRARTRQRFAGRRKAAA